MKQWVRMIEWTDEFIEGINKPMNEWMNEWMNQWINEWINEWMNECMNELSDEPMSNNDGWIKWIHSKEFD